MTTTQPRVSPGVPSGGQFAAASHAEPDQLDLPTVDPSAIWLGLPADIGARHLEPHHVRWNAIGFVPKNMEWPPTPVDAAADHHIVLAIHDAPPFDLDPAIDPKSVEAYEALNDHVSEIGKRATELAAAERTITGGPAQTVDPGMYSASLGARFERDDIVIIAKATREDLQAAVAAGLIPDVRYSVRTSRYAGGQSLSVTVDGLPDSVLYSNEPDPWGNRQRSPYSKALNTQLERILAARNKTSIHGEVDYFNVHHYARVEINDERTTAWWEMDAQVRKAESAYRSAVRAGDQQAAANAARDKTAAEQDFRERYASQS